MKRTTGSQQHRTVRPRATGGDDSRLDDFIAARIDPTPAELDDAIEHLDRAIADYDSTIAWAKAEANSIAEKAERDSPLSRVEREGSREWVAERMRRDLEQLRPEAEGRGELERSSRDSLADLGRWAGELGASHEKSLPIAQKLIRDMWGEDFEVCPFETYRGLLDSWGKAYTRGLARREAKLRRKLDRVTRGLAQYHRRRRERRGPQLHAAACNAGRTRRRSPTSTRRTRSRSPSRDPGEPSCSPAAALCSRGPLVNLAGAREAIGR